jgi:hypothetical protein
MAAVYGRPAKIDSAVVPREIQDSWIRCERLGVRGLEKPQHRILSEGPSRTC